jgi:hypothetical protein
MYLNTGGSPLLDQIAAQFGIPISDLMNGQQVGPFAQGQLNPMPTPPPIPGPV